MQRVLGSCPSFGICQCVHIEDVDFGIVLHSASCCGPEVGFHSSNTLFRAGPLGSSFGHIEHNIYFATSSAANGLSSNLVVPLDAIPSTLRIEPILPAQQTRGQILSAPRGRLQYPHPSWNRLCSVYFRCSGHRRRPTSRADASLYQPPGAGGHRPRPRSQRIRIPVRFANRPTSRTLHTPQPRPPAHTNAAVDALIPPHVSYA